MRVSLFIYIDIARVFNDKQFNELENDEDYKKLLVASPELGNNIRKNITSNEIQVVPQPIAPPVRELVRLISRERAPYGDIGNNDDAFPLPNDEIGEGNNGKQSKDDELKGISITGVSALKVELKGVQSVSEKDKKQVGTKLKLLKENKKIPSVLQPANLSIMVL